MPRERLLLPDADSDSEADFINEKGQIVGIAWDCNYNFTAVIWENGSMVGLNTLISPDAGFYLFSASFIDNAGRVAAFGLQPNGDTHALVLVPCQEGDKDCVAADKRLPCGLQH